MLFRLDCVSVISKHRTSGHTVILNRLVYCVLCPEQIALCKLLYFNIVESPHTNTHKVVGSSNSDHAYLLLLFVLYCHLVDIECIVKRSLALFDLESF